MKRIFALTPVCCALVVFLGHIGSALAQDDESLWLKDRRYREGIGFRVGDFELHPGVGAEFGYDSNYFLRASDEDPIGSLRLRISPSFSVSTLSEQRRGEDGGPPPSVDFRADLRATYHEFIPVSGSEAGKDRLQEQRNVSGELNLALDILPKRTWSGHLGGGVGRTVRPTNEGDLTESFNRVLPRGEAELIWTPNSGLLDWRLGYNFEGTFFESGTFSELNHFENTIITRGRWRFLPRTAMIYDLGLGFVSYPDGASKTSSHPLRARIGVNGLITNSFAVLAMAGWGASFYSLDEAEDFDSVIGQLELKWYLTANPSADPMKASSSLSALSVGFVREFQDSYIGTYLERDRGYAKFNYLISGVFLLAIQGGAGAVIFPIQQDPTYGQPAGWTDVRIDGELLGEYRIKDFIGISANFAYTGYLSSTRLSFPNVSPGIQDNLAYQHIRTFLGVRWFM